MRFYTPLFKSHSINQMKTIKLTKEELRVLYEILLQYDCESWIDGSDKRGIKDNKIKDKILEKIK